MGLSHKSSFRAFTRQGRKRNFLHREEDVAPPLIRNSVVVSRRSRASGWRCSLSASGSIHGVSMVHSAWCMEPCSKTFVSAPMGQEIALTFRAGMLAHAGFHRGRTVDCEDERARTWHILESARDRCVRRRGSGVCLVGSRSRVNLIRHPII